MSAAHTDDRRTPSKEAERSRPLSPPSSVAPSIADAETDAGPVQSASTKNETAISLSDNAMLSIERSGEDTTVAEAVTNAFDPASETKQPSKRWPTPPFDRVWAVDTFKGKSNRASLERMLAKAGKDPNELRFRHMTVIGLQQYCHDLQRKTMDAQAGMIIADSSDEENVEASSTLNRAENLAVPLSGNSGTHEADFQSDFDEDFDSENDSEVDQAGITRASAALKAIKRATLYDSAHRTIDVSDDVDSDCDESDEDAEADVQSTYTWKTMLYTDQNEPVVSYKAQLLVREIINLRKKLQNPATDADFQKNIDAGITVPKFKRKCNVIANEIAKMIESSDSKFQAKGLVNKILVGSFRAGKI